MNDDKLMSLILEIGILARGIDDFSLDDENKRVLDRIERICEDIEIDWKVKQANEKLQPKEKLTPQEHKERHYYPSDEISLNIQQLIRSYYTQWMQIGQHRLPDLTDCLDFMLTEVSEAIELRLRRVPYVRNNPRELPTDEEIGTEIFDAIMMGCIALDILNLDLQEIALEKLECMHRKRVGNELQPST